MLRILPAHSSSLDNTCSSSRLRHLISRLDLFCRFHSNSQVFETETAICSHTTSSHSHSTSSEQADEIPGLEGYGEEKEDETQDSPSQERVGDSSQPDLVESLRHKGTPALFNPIPRFGSILWRWSGNQDDLIKQVGQNDAMESTETRRFLQIDPKLDHGHAQVIRVELWGVVQNADPIDLEKLLEAVKPTEFPLREVEQNQELHDSEENKLELKKGIEAQIQELAEGTNDQVENVFQAKDGGGVEVSKDGNVNDGQNSESVHEDFSASESWTGLALSPIVLLGVGSISLAGNQTDIQLASPPKLILKTRTYDPQGNIVERDVNIDFSALVSQENSVQSSRCTGIKSTNSDSSTDDSDKDELEGNKLSSDTQNAFHLLGSIVVERETPLSILSCLQQAILRRSIDLSLRIACEWREFNQSSAFSQDALDLNSNPVLPSTANRPLQAILSQDPIRASPPPLFKTDSLEDMSGESRNVSLSPEIQFHMNSMQAEEQIAAVIESIAMIKFELNAGWKKDPQRSSVSAQNVPIVDKYLDGILTPYRAFAQRIRNSSFSQSESPINLRSVQQKEPVNIDETMPINERVDEKKEKDSEVLNHIKSSPSKALTGIQGGILKNVFEAHG